MAATDNEIDEEMVLIDQICRAVPRVDDQMPEPTYSFIHRLIMYIEGSADLTLTRTIPTVLRRVYPTIDTDQLNIGAVVRHIKGVAKKSVKNGDSSLMLKLYSPPGCHPVTAIGDYCENMGITPQWLEGSDVLAAERYVNNGVVFELYKYVNSSKYTWKHAVVWAKRLFNTLKEIPRGTLLSSWKSVASKQRNLRFTLEERKRFLDAPYQFMSLNSVNANDVAENDNVANDALMTGSTSDEYSSLVGEVERLYVSEDKLTKCLESALEYSLGLEVENELLKEEKVKELNNLKKALSVSEKSLAVSREKLSMYNTRNVNKRAKTAQKKICDLQKENRDLSDEIKKQCVEKQSIVMDYDLQLNALHNQVEELQKQLTEESSKKRKYQKRASYYRVTKKTLVEQNEKELDDLKKQMNQLRTGDACKTQLDTVMDDPIIETFSEGKYSDEVRLVCYDLLQRGVGTRHVSDIIRTVLSTFLKQNVSIDRLPKTSLIKMMAVEANVLSKSQVAKKLFENENSTLQFDGTSKRQKHYIGFQVATADGENLSTAMKNTTCGSVESQLEDTKTILQELSELLSDSDNHSSQDNMAHKLLFNIKNTMSDRHIVNKGYVRKLEEWRSSVLPEVIENWSSLSPEKQKEISVVNDFFCGLHFLTGLGDYAESTLKEWEDILGKKLGSDAMSEFHHWNETSSATQRLIRHTCEVLSGGRVCTNEQAGYPFMFKSVQLKERKNHLKDFVGNRFNILFENGAAVYHHRWDAQNF